MVHALGLERDARHEAEGRAEVGEAVLAVELAGGEAPARQLGERARQLVRAEPRPRHQFGAWIAFTKASNSARAIVARVALPCALRKALSGMMPFAIERWPPPSAHALDHGAHHLAGRAHVADVAHREHEVGAHHAGRDRPLGALGLEPEVRHLRDHVLAHAPEHEQVDAFVDARARERAPERAQAGARQRRPLDAPQQRGAVVGVHEGEGADVVVARVAPEQLRVALDAVEQGGRELGPHLDARGLEILGEDGRGRAVARCAGPSAARPSRCARGGGRSRRRAWSRAAAAGRRTRSAARPPARGRRTRRARPA